MKAPDSHNDDRELLSMDDARASSARLLALSVVCDGGRYYYFGQYRYDNLQCAIDYAERQQARSKAAPVTPMQISPKSSAPSSADRDT